MLSPLCKNNCGVRTDTDSGICRVCDPLQRLVNWVLFRLRFLNEVLPIGCFSIICFFQMIRGEVFD